MLCMWTTRPHKHQMCTQVQESKETMAISLSGTRAKTKIMADHPAQQHAQAAIPSSDGTTVKTIMTQPVQLPPLQTIQINENNEIGRWMNT